VSECLSHLSNVHKVEQVPPEFIQVVSFGTRVKNEAAILKQGLPSPRIMLDSHTHSLVSVKVTGEIISDQVPPK
jgi:hypothetical protein